MKQITLLQLISFLTGFCLMAYELVAARILAPSIGSSTYVWTSVIGLIIAALSAGYWVGGKVADIRHRPVDIAILCLAVAVAVAWTLVSYNDFLGWLATTGLDVRFQAVIASTVLFVPASFVLGTISPYLVKLAISSLDTSGQSVASLSASNSIGGIIGTFLTGFFIFGYVGSRQALLMLIVIMIVASWLIVPKRRVKWRAAVSIIVVVVGIIASSTHATTSIASIDTPSARYEVVSASVSQQPVIGLSTGPRGLQSAIYPDQPGKLVFWYTNELARIAKEQKPSSILILGGGAFTLPEHLGKALPEATIDVVEIDHGIEKISRDYFGFTDLPNVNLIFDDARTYVNHTTSSYDLILVDVYGDTSIPFHLMTREYGQGIGRILADDGYVAANIIAGSSGPCGDLLRVALGSYAAGGLERVRLSYHFPDTNLRQNIIAEFPRQGTEFPQSHDVFSDGYLQYTDDFAPLELLHDRCQSTD